MSRREVVDCDRCGAKEIGDEGHVSAVVGTQVGVSGSEDHTEEFDLCASCLRDELQRLLRKMNYQEAEKWVKAMRLQKAR